MQQTALGIAGAAAVLVAVILLIDFVETSRDIATRADISAVYVFYLTTLKAPLLVQETLPFIVLFGVLWSFFRLNRRSELIVMRASGYSAWRMLTPPLLLAGLLGVFGATLLNPIGAAANAAFDRAREQVLEGRTGAESRPDGPVWLREATTDGYIIISGAQLRAESARIEQPVFHIYTFLEGGAAELDRRIDAETAELGGGFWSLADAVERRVGEAPAGLGDIALPTSIGAQALFERARSPGGVSFWRLPDVIASARQAGLSTRAYELRWHALASQPVILIAAALLAVAATLRLVRLGGAAGFAMAGGLSGFLLYFVQELMLSLGSAGALSPVSAAWTAPLVFSAAALFYVASTEDG
jgi:lipopolysaccharide export system permease protein